ncbi:hypothetical protein LguiB_024582 [Lonicera macranthoides]
MTFILGLIVLLIVILFFKPFNKSLFREIEQLFFFSFLKRTDITYGVRASGTRKREEKQNSVWKKRKEMMRERRN